MKNVYYCLALVFLVSSCSGGGGNNAKSVPPAPTFIYETIRLAGAGAEDCGEVAIGEAVNEINACVTNAFNLYQAFYAIYRRQGIDSNVATGFAYDSQSLFIVEFDDFSCSPSSNCNAFYNVLECLSPMANPSDSQEAMNGNPFTCADWVEVPAQ